MHFPLCVGEIGQPWFGTAQQAPPHGEKPRPEPLPVPGLLCPQPSVQRHVLHPGATGCIHQPTQRPLDAQGLRCPAAQPHILVSTSVVPLDLVINIWWISAFGRQYQVDVFAQFPSPQYISNTYSVKLLSSCTLSQCSVVFFKKYYTI